MTSVLLRHLAQYQLSSVSGLPRTCTKAVSNTTISYRVTGLKFMTPMGDVDTEQQWAISSSGCCVTSDGREGRRENEEQKEKRRKKRRKK